MESEEIKNAVTAVLTADEATARNHEDATKAYETLKEIHDEIQKKFQEYIKDNEYSIHFAGRRATASFTGTEVTVPKDSADIGLKLSVKPAEDQKSGELQIVDNYGNPVGEVKEALTYSIPTAAFEESTVFFDGDEEIAAEVKEDKYVFTTKAVNIQYKAGEGKAAEQPAASKTTSKSTLITAGVVIVAALAAVLLRKKHTAK